MSSADITVREILARKIKDTVEEFELYSEDDFDDGPLEWTYAECKAQYDGELRAYREMLTAIENGVSEKSFTEYFHDKLEEYQEIFRQLRSAENVIDINSGVQRDNIVLAERGGYCSAAKTILNLYYPVYTDEDFE